MKEFEKQGLMATPSVRQPLDSAARGSAEWCLPEIQHAFEKVADAIDDFSGSGQTEQALFERASLSLHQGLGALRVMSLSGLDVFADTLEKLFEAKEDQKVDWSAQNVATVKRALNALMEYLEDLISGELSDYY